MSGCVNYQTLQAVEEWYFSQIEANWSGLSGKETLAIDIKIKGIRKINLKVWLASVLETTLLFLIKVELAALKLKEEQTIPILQVIHLYQC